MNTYDIIVLANDEDRNMDDVLHTVLDGALQSLKPKTILVAININGIKDQQLVTLIDDAINDKCEWKVDFLYPQVKQDDGEIVRLNRSQTLDYMADKSKSTYYCVFNAGRSIPNDFLAKVDDSERFVLAEPIEDGNGLVVNKNLHDMLHGNKQTILERYNDTEVLVGDDIVEKAKFVAKQNKQEKYIKKVQDICLSFQR